MSQVLKPRADGAPPEGNRVAVNGTTLRGIPARPPAIAPPPDPDSGFRHLAGDFVAASVAKQARSPDRYGKTARPEEIAVLPEAVRAVLPDAPAEQILVRPNGRVVSAQKNDVAATAQSLASRVLEADASAELKI